MTILVPCTARLCSQISGVGPTTDVAIYNPQDGLLFNGVPLSFLVTCPEGYYCPPGSFPRVITYPPGTFVIPEPTAGGFPIVLQLQGCQSLVSRTLAADATEAEIQAAANEIILEVGQQQAECDSQPPAGQELPTNITLSEIATFFCLEETWDVTITTDAPASAQPLTFLVIGGDLPSGITQSQSTTEFFLTGTAAAMGTYNFTLAVGGVGAYGQQAYSVVVGGITTASPLPDATTDTPYSEVLAQSGLTGTLTWGVEGGLTELPSWLSLNTASGTLFGTPPADAEGPYTFTITVTNGVNTCSKEFTLDIAASAVCGDLFAGTTWGQVSSYEDNGATTVASGVGTEFDSVSTSPQADAFCAGPIETIRGTFKDFEGVVSYTGPEVECCVRVTVSGSPYYTNNPAPGIAATSTCSGYAQVYVDGGAILLDHDYFDDTGNGTFDYTFTIPECLVPTDIIVAAGTSADTSATTDVSCFYPDQSAPQAQMTIAIELGVC
jgi:hypothetical protein